MSSFFVMREWAAGTVRPYPCPSLLRGLTHLILGRAEGMPWRFAGHGTVIAPGLCTIFSALERAGILPGWRGSFRTPVARTALWLRPPFWGDVLCYISFPSPGEYFLLSCVSRCSAGALWKDVRKQKGPPARSRWPLISRRETAAYSPATAFWCSAMTLSATGWGASS